MGGKSTKERQSEVNFVKYVKEKIDKGYTVSKLSKKKYDKYYHGSQKYKDYLKKYE